MLLNDIKKLPIELVNEGVKHNLNSKFNVSTKRIDELKVLETKIVDATGDTDEITRNFAAKALEVNIQEALSRTEFIKKNLAKLDRNQTNSMYSLGVKFYLMLDSIQKQ